MDLNCANGQEVDHDLASAPIIMVSLRNLTEEPLSTVSHHLMNAAAGQISWANNPHKLCNK